MMRKHFSEVKTLKGRTGLCFRKCLFSVTRTSAPTHSVYAAMSASASLSPMASYLKPISKGMEKSSSMVEMILMNLMKFWNSLGIRFVRTSSTIVRHTEIGCDGKLSMSSLKRDSQLSFFANPRANMYSLASSTRRKLFLPEFFSGFTQLFNNLFFGHACERGGSLGYVLPQFVPQFFGFGFFSFHLSSPRFQDYYSAYEMSRRKMEKGVRKIYG